jgi:hypothetical protein
MCRRKKCIRRRKGRIKEIETENEGYKRKCMRIQNILKNKGYEGMEARRGTRQGSKTRKGRHENKKRKL